MEDWLRWPAEEFEKKLRRAAAHHRPAYLGERGEFLADSGDLDGARELLMRALDFPDVFAFYEKGILDALARVELLSGDTTAAESIYRQVISRWPDSGGVDGGAEIYLAEIVSARGETREATDLLNGWIAREAGQTFDYHLFRYAVCAVRIAVIEDDVSSAREWAERALEVAARAAPFPKHPGAGTAHPTEEQLRMLHEKSET